MPKANQIISELNTKIKSAEPEIQTKAFNKLFKLIDKIKSEKKLIVLAPVLDTHWEKLTTLWRKNMVDMDAEMPAILRLSFVNKNLAEKTLDHMLAQLPQEILAYIYGHFHIEKLFNVIKLSNYKIDISHLDLKPVDSYQFKQYTAQIFFLCHVHTELQKKIKPKIIAQLEQMQADIPISSLEDVLEKGQQPLYETLDLKQIPIYDVEFTTEQKNNITFALFNYRQHQVDNHSNIVHLNQTYLFEHLIKTSSSALVDYLAYRLYLLLPDNLALSTIRNNNKKISKHDHIIGQYLLQQAQQNVNAFEFLNKLVRIELYADAKLKGHINAYLPAIINVQVKRLTPEAAEWLYFTLKIKSQNPQRNWPILAERAQLQNTDSHPNVQATIKTLLWIASGQKKAVSTIINAITIKHTTIPKDINLFNQNFCLFPHLNMGEIILSVLQHEALSQSIADQLFSKISIKQHTRISEMLKSNNWELDNLISDPEEDDELEDDVSMDSAYLSCSHIIGLVCLALRWPSIRQRTLNYIIRPSVCVQKLPCIENFSIPDFPLNEEWVDCFLQALHQHKDTLTGYHSTFEKFKLAYAMDLPDIYLPIAQYIGESIAKIEGQEIKAQAWLMTGLQMGEFSNNVLLQDHYIPQTPTLTTLLSIALGMSLLSFPDIRQALFIGLGGREDITLPTLTYINMNQWTLSNIDVSAISFGLDNSSEILEVLSVSDVKPEENLKQLKANTKYNVKLIIGPQESDEHSQQPTALTYAFAQTGATLNDTTEPRVDTPSSPKNQLK